MNTIWELPQSNDIIYKSEKIINGKIIIIYMGCFLLDPKILGIPRPITSFVFNNEWMFPTCSNDRNIQIKLIILIKI